MPLLESLSRRDWMLAIIAAFVAAAVWGMTARSEVPDVSDSRQYAWAAWHLAHDGVFSEEAKSGPVQAAMGREPGYPAFLGLLLKFAPGLGSVSPTCLSQEQGCGMAAWRPGLIANGAFIGLTAFTAFMATFWLSGSRLAAWLCEAHVCLNAQAASGRGYLLSDYMAMMLVTAASAALIWAIQRGAWRWILTGLSFAALTLTKAIFLWLVIPAAFAAFLVMLMRRWTRAQILIALALFALGYVPPVGAWMVRNAQIGHLFTLTAGRTAITLSMREVFNHMTPVQYGAAFMYWTRGFGDDLAKSNFPKEVWEPFELYRPGSFYMEGQHRLDPEMSRLLRSGLTLAEADKILSTQMIERILDKPIAYALSTFPLFWRGIWIDEFIVFSLPALVWLLISGIRSRRLDICLAVCPGVFSLTFYALVSLNVPRYQLTAIPTLAMAFGIAGAWGITLWQSRRKNTAGQSI